jgi:hypothetical protein
VREHAWGDGPGVRCCAGACPGEVRVVEAAAQVSSLRLMAPTDAACAARVLAAAASPAPAFASPVFLVTCAFGDAAVGEGGEGGCRSCQEGNGARSSHWRTPPPPLLSCVLTYPHLLVQLTTTSHARWSLTVGCWMVVMTRRTAARLWAAKVVGKRADNTL